MSAVLNTSWRGLGNKSSPKHCIRTCCFFLFPKNRKMAPRKMTMGKGAKVSCLMKYLHPSKHIRDKYPNLTAQQRLEGMVVVRQEMKRITRKERMALVVTHDDFHDDDGLIELHGYLRWFTLVAEGPPEFFFDRDADSGEKEGERQEQEQQQPMPEAVRRIDQRGHVNTTDLNQLRGVVDIDDDNEPAPENIPPAAASAQSDIFKGWEHDGVCHRRRLNPNNSRASLKNFPRDVVPNRVQLFEHFFPKEYVKEVIIPETNKHLGDNPLTFGEFLRFVGIFFLMATTSFENRRDFWSTSTISMFKGAPFRFNELMSRYRFDAIVAALRLTSSQPPAYKDRFWEVRDLIAAWNKNMDSNFNPSWISCLDESMSKWVNEYTCPGFILCPRKPWPLGNEYHTIACGLSVIIYQLELVEGKDEPVERVRKPFSQLGKTIGLLLRLTKPLWHTSKVVVLDSGFCVLKGLVAIRKKGVFAAALIKKRRYWPKFIRGDEIKEHFKDKEVGTAEAWRGELDDVPFHVYCLKEPDYVMSLMSTYGVMEVRGKEQTRSYKKDGATKTVKFQYPEVVHNHFTYRDSVDSNNSSRMDPIALEEVWKTTRWPLRVFQFLLAVSEVNCRMAQHHIYGEAEMGQQEFRKLFSHDLIYNEYLENYDTGGGSRKSPRKRDTGHELMTLEPYMNFKGSQMFRGKTRSVQRVCTLCKTKRCNTYCRCNPGTFLCGGCIITHILEAINNESSTNYK